MEFLGFLYVIVSIAIYLAPTVVANYRSHKNATAILVFNIFLGWTFIGWVAALVWSFTGERGDQIGGHGSALNVRKTLGISELKDKKIARLESDRDDGLITEEEFILKRDKILNEV
jgi:hypothetical protein